MAVQGTQRSHRYHLLADVYVHRSEDKSHIATRFRRDGPACLSRDTALRIQHPDSSRRVLQRFAVHVSRRIRPGRCPITDRFVEHRAIHQREPMFVRDLRRHAQRGALCEHLDLPAEDVPVNSIGAEAPLLGASNFAELSYILTRADETGRSSTRGVPRTVVAEGVYPAETVFLLRVFQP